MLFSRKLDQLVPYVAGEQPKDKKYIKLNTNENAYPPCPGIRDYLRTMAYEDLKLYPDADAEELRAVLADFHKVKPSNIFVGNGSDEVLSFAFYAFFDPGFPVLFPEFTYSFYPVYCDFYGLSKKTIPMKNGFEIDLDDYLLEGDYSFIFPNPNAPTGICLEKRRIQKFLSDYSSKNPVIVDEAYIDFGGETVIDCICEHKNLLVVRTLSKSAALAGMRIGYAVGDEKMISALRVVKDSFNSYTVNRISQECARIAILEWDYYRRNINRIIATREKLSEFLVSAGWEVLPSKSNFIFARNPGLSGSDIYTTLRNRGVLVRHFKKEKINDFVRISIGNDQEIESFIDCVKRNTGAVK